MAKMPWMQFYPADYLLDTQPLSPAARGIWMELICLLWRSDSRGTLTMTPAQWSRVLRCDVSVFVTVCDELDQFAVCDIVTNGNDTVTVRSRRMVREEKQRKSVRLRVSRHRSNKTCNAPVPECNQENQKSESEVRIRSQNQKSESEEEKKKREGDREQRAAAPPRLSVLDRLERFRLTPELDAWAVKEGIANPGQYVEEFKDYWRSTGGRRKNGQDVKDFDAAFRNRLRQLKAAGRLLSGFETLEERLRKWADDVEVSA